MMLESGDVFLQGILNLQVFPVESNKHWTISRIEIKQGFSASTSCNLWISN